MKTNQTSSDPVHLPVIVGASTSGLGRGIFDSMKKPETPIAGTLDYYRKMAESNPDIAALVEMLDRQRNQLVNALEALCELQAKRMAAAKILASDAA